MSFLVPCPDCGKRDVNEFGYRGEVTTRPTPAPGEAPSRRELTEYLYLRANVAGLQREWWHHRHGCGGWFVAERDTRTNEIVAVERP